MAVNHQVVLKFCFSAQSEHNDDYSFLHHDVLIVYKQKAKF